MNIFELFQLISFNLWLYGGAFILVLSILVFIHEWGHYIIARLCGVRVETFSIGFGKELFGWTDGHGTRWKFSLIPLGGYVKLFGDVNPDSTSHAHDKEVENKKTHEYRPMSAEERRVAFFAKPVWKRASIVIAGPAINYIFAIIILTGLFTFNGKPTTPPVAGAVVAGSSAEAAGFQPHDLVISVDGKPIFNFEDIRREMMIALDSPKHFIVERDGKTMEINATPKREEERDRFGFSHSRGVLGLMGPKSAINIETITAINGRKIGDIEAVRSELQSRMGETLRLGITFDKNGPEQTYIVKPLQAFNEGLSNPESLNHQLLFIANSEGEYFAKFGPVDSFVKALEETWSITRGTLEAMSQIVVGSRSTKELGGIVRIGAMAGDMAQQGVIALILFTALLSINLGLINLFPIPLLDGGHLVFYAIEAVSGRPVPDRIQDYAFRAGFVFLIGVMVFANINDILQIIL